MSQASTLIVEDQAVVAADLAAKVEALGYRVVGIVSTGERAIDIARSQAPDVALMDIRLAGPLDGIETAKRLQSLYDTPVVFVTAHSDSDTLKRASLSGHCGYLLKPVHERDLATQLEIALYKHQTEGLLRASEERLRTLATRLEQLVDERTSELVESQKQLRALTVQLELTEQRARTKLAGELHDHLAQLLVLANLQLSQLKKASAQNQSRAKLLNQIQDLIAQSLAYTRTLVVDLSPPALHESGLLAALRWLAGSMRRYDLHVVVDAMRDDILLPEALRVLIFQSVRELLINAAKHARSPTATVRARVAEGKLEIVVQDQGAGFDPKTTDAGIRKKRNEKNLLSSGFGLLSVRERMNALGGTFHIASSPHQGTTATLVLPLPEARP